MQGSGSQIVIVLPFDAVSFEDLLTELTPEELLELLQEALEDELFPPELGDLAIDPGDVTASPPDVAVANVEADEDNAEPQPVVIEPIFVDGDPIFGMDFDAELTDVDGSETLLFLTLTLSDERPRQRPVFDARRHAAQRRRRIDAQRAPISPAIPSR